MNFSPLTSSFNAASSSNKRRSLRCDDRTPINSTSPLRRHKMMMVATTPLLLLLSSATFHSVSASSSSFGIVPLNSKKQEDGFNLSEASDTFTTLWDEDRIVNVVGPWDSSRLMQEVDADHEEGEDHEHEEGEDHEDEDHNGLEEDHDHEDEDHDHEEVTLSASATAEEEDHAHEDHEEGEDHDEHDDHEEDEHLHDDHDDHDDHDGHSHSSAMGQDEFTSTSSNEAKANNNNEPWGAVIGATLLVNLATFSGVLLLVLPVIYRGVLKYRNVPVGSSPAAHGHGKFYDIVIPGFAVGALVATAVFLVLPESVKYLSGGEGHASHAGEEDDHSGHGHRYLEEDSHAGGGSAAAKFGCSVLGGFLLPFVFAIFFHHPEVEDDSSDNKRDGRGASVMSEEECPSCAGEAADDVETGVAVGANNDKDEGDTDAFVDNAADGAQPVVNKRLCASILLGDGFHNFADGFFIAAAFRSCSVGVAISIMLVTLFHEIAQELADFIVLTKFGGLPVWTALAFNFLSGLTVCLGGIVFLAANPSDVVTGVILAMAGGVYINIAAVETAPRMEGAMKCRSDRILMLFSIILGTIPLGLILLDHKHCD